MSGDKLKMEAQQSTINAATAAQVWLKSKNSLERPA